MMLQHRGGSPSLANLNALMSPTSPFSTDGLSGPPTHQRHQSLQYPILAHQFQQTARASPRLQDLREVDEEAPQQEPVEDTGARYIHAAQCQQQLTDRDR